MNERNNNDKVIRNEIFYIYDFSSLEFSDEYEIVDIAFISSSLDFYDLFDLIIKSFLLILKYYYRKTSFEL